MVRCADGSLYTDTAEDVDAAVKSLNEGSGSGYVKTRMPVFLAYAEEYMNCRDAEARAVHIRKLDRRGKEHLLALANMRGYGELAFAS